MSSPIRDSRFFFFAILILLIGLFLAFDNAWLPVGFIHSVDTYALSVITVALTLSGTYIVLSWIKYLKYWQRSSWWSMYSVGRRYIVWTSVRTLLLFVMGTWNVTVYFGSADYATSSKYCILITLIAALFCIPGRSEYERFYK